MLRLSLQILLIAKHTQQKSGLNCLANEGVINKYLVFFNGFVLFDNLFEMSLSPFSYTI